MTLDPTETYIASNGAISVAPVGTTMPTTADETLNGAFEDLGYLTEDGVTLNWGVEVGEHGAWQSDDVIRREVTKRNVSATGQLEQWNERTVITAFGGSVTDLGGGDVRYDPPASTAALPEIAVVIDSQDGEDNLKRFIFPRVNVTDDIETQFRRTELALIPVTFKALRPSGGGLTWNMLTNDPAFAAAS